MTDPKSTAESTLKLPPGPVMLDVAGLTLTDADARRIAHPCTGGVILFARNYANRTQLLTLTQQIRAIRSDTGSDILIAVDHEGGRVQRFRGDGFTELPPMRALGELWDRDVLLATKVATDIGYVIGSELRTAGIDLSFTPILDLDYGVSDVIGNRALHSDPRVVTLLAKSLTHGLALAGMANCGKHFPGHGAVAADSHHALPVDHRPLAEILRADARPYEWLGLALAAVMPAHVVYPQVDDQPAGFSKIWLQQILRQQLGFDGLIFSDDLAMEGARAAGTALQAAQHALEAGCDMVLICNQPDMADEILDGLAFNGVSNNGLQRRRVNRMSRMRARGRALSWEELMQETEYIRAVEQIKTGISILM
jgi:beta-N-acetylhexosaminidase